MVDGRIPPLLELARGGAELRERDEIGKEKMAHDVFICHSAKDKTTADAVCAMLESNGIRCWIAPRDVTAGMEWSECIIDAIEECRVMVLVFTTNANESSQIRREVERAVNRGVAILPLRIEDILPGRALEYFIGNVHWLDAMTPPLESHLQNLAGTVKILLGRLPRHDVPMPHGEAISADAIPQIDPPRYPNPTPQPNPTPERITIPQQAEIPQPPPVQPIAPKPYVSAEPVRPPTAQQIPVERVPEIPPQVQPKQIDPPPAPPTASTSHKQKRAIGIVVIAVVVFLFSCIGLAGTFHDSIYGRFQLETGLGLLLCVTGVVTSYGLITKKSWGRILQLIFSAACVVWLLTLTPDASDAADIGLLLFAFGFSGFAIQYMSSKRVKQEFAQAAVERQKYFASNFVSTGPAASGRSGIVSGISARGTGRRPPAVLVIAILSFVEAGIWMIPISQDIGRNRLQARDFSAFLVCAAVAIGFGLIKLMGWARLLKVVVSAVDAVLMISVAQDAFREGGFGEVMWIVMFIYIIWSAWYLFAPRMKGVFSKAA
jgi:hypothetical protein